MTVDALNLESGQPNDLLCSDGHQRRQPRHIPVTAMADDRRGAPPRSQMPRHPLVICAARFRIWMPPRSLIDPEDATGRSLGVSSSAASKSGQLVRGLGAVAGAGAMSLRCPAGLAVNRPTDGGDSAWA